MKHIRLILVIFTLSLHAMEKETDHPDMLQHAKAGRDQLTFFIKAYKRIWNANKKELIKENKIDPNSNIAQIIDQLQEEKAEDLFKNQEVYALACKIFNTPTHKDAFDLAVSKTEEYLNNNSDTLAILSASVPFTQPQKYYENPTFTPITLDECLSLWHQAQQAVFSIVATELKENHNVTLDFSANNEPTSILPENAPACNKKLICTNVDLDPSASLAYFKAGLIVQALHNHHNQKIILGSLEYFGKYVAEKICTFASNFFNNPFCPTED